MASFTGVGDNTTLNVARRGTVVDIALSGTYNMQIDLQRERVRGSGAWEKVKTVSTVANATVADVYTTPQADESLRLIVIVDTSGTCTATLTDREGEELLHVKDAAGNTLYQVYEGGAFVPKNTPVSITAATALTREKHSWRPLVVSGGTGFAITMPEATGSGDKYFIHYNQTISAGSHTIVAPSAATEFNGAVTLSTDIAGVSILAADGDDTITMSGTTTGGVVGTHFVFTDVAAGVFHVGGHIVTSGAEADPFSANVS